MNTCICGEKPKMIDKDSKTRYIRCSCGVSVRSIRGDTVNQLITRWRQKIIFLKNKKE